jgi:hypothetical protein
LANNLKGNNYCKEKDMMDILTLKEEEDTEMLPSPYKAVLVGLCHLLHSDITYTALFCK